MGRTVTFSLTCFVYFLEVALLCLVVYRQQWRRLGGVLLYLGSLFLIDGVGRTYVFYRHGLSSLEYAYFFWLTDVLLTLAAFLLVCSFFRRACFQEEKMWRFLRMLLTLVFVLVMGISFFSLLHNYDNLFTLFIVEFQQNLYFTCLVLTTLLYLLMQQLQSADEELTLLVTGMGIQFAGPAANFALVHLTPDQEYASVLYTYLGPLCTLGMLLTWLHAFTRIPEVSAAPATPERVAVLEAVGPRET